MNVYSVLIKTAIAIVTAIGCCSANGQEGQYDWGALHRGEVLIDSVKSAQGVPGVRAVFVIEAPREKIWATLLDYDNFPKFFDGIDEMKVLHSDEKGARVEFWVDAVLKKLHYVLSRDYVTLGYELTWKRISGDLKDIQGSWKIEDTEDPERKLLIYDSYVDLGVPIVTWAIRIGAKKKAKEMAYRLRDWIESVAQPNSPNDSRP